MDLSYVSDQEARKEICMLIVGGTSNSDISTRYRIHICNLSKRSRQFAGGKAKVPVGEYFGFGAVRGDTDKGS